LEVPVRQLAENSGFDGAVIAQKIKESKDTSFGFNAEKDEFEDLVKAGIVDPTKVVRAALENAASMAALLLTTESLVIEIPEKKDKTMAPPPYPEY
jgi:chaperonin GroEL